MAGDWIKMRTVLQTSPKVVRIASALDADRLRTVGGLHSAWCLFDAHSDDGRLDGYTPEVLDSMIGWPGFTEAMASVGWLLITSEALELPEFDAHNGQSAKRRAQEADRKRKARTSAKASASEADKNGTREEKRREENIDNTNVLSKPEKVPRGTRKTKLPDDFILTAHRQDLATSYWRDKNRPDLVPRVQEIFDQFTNHAKANGKSFVDWDAAWTTWYSNALKFERPQHGHSVSNAGSGKLSRDEQIERAAEEYLNGSQGSDGRILEGAYEVETGSPDAGVARIPDLGAKLQ